MEVRLRTGALGDAVVRHIDFCLTKAIRATYYDRLMSIRLDGDWEGWTKFFLTGVAETAEEATATAGAIVAMRDTHQRAVQRLGANGLSLLDILFTNPLVNGRFVSERVGVSAPTAHKLLQGFTELGILHETTGYRRNRVFRYTPYLDLFVETMPTSSESTPIQETASAADDVLALEAD